MADDDKFVARGATLYGNRNSKKEPRKKRRPYDPNYFNIQRPKDEENLTKIIKFIQQQGTKMDFYKHKYLIRRTRSRIARTSATSYLEYLKILKESPEELKLLIDALSINVTRFFRNNDSWDNIKSEVIPEIVKFKRSLGQNTIRIWSAGCAVGAEPYSLSIIVDDKKWKDMNFKIIASDINDDLLNIAQYGRYSDEYLQEMSKTNKLEYFKSHPKGVYEVKPKIKSRVTFTQLDLTRDKYPNQLDLIVCRNVMIYMKRDAQTVIKDKFTKALNPKGYLILGRTETLSGEWSSQYENINIRHRIYRKQ